MKRNDLVILKAKGYENQIAYITERAPSDSDGVERYTVTRRGSFTEIRFRVDEFREPTEAERGYIRANHKIKAV